MKQPMLQVQGINTDLPVGAILDTATGKTITFDALLDQLAPARVVYVGERHNVKAHHEIQLRIIQGLAQKGLQLGIGMEMFDHTYQAKLDQWTKGEMSYEKFLEQTHWYANWRFNDTLYKDILIYIKDNQLPLIGLNVPFHLPRKISIGGLDSLSPSERALLPDTIDTSIADHRTYVETVFKGHAIRGRKNFDHFYEAQCTWEDGMAEAIARHLTTDTMVVLVGNGHIFRHFGIPDRAYARTEAPFRTVYLASPGMEVERRDGDFIWVAPTSPHRRQR